MDTQKGILYHILMAEMWKSYTMHYVLCVCVCVCAYTILTPNTTHIESIFTGKLEGGE